MSYKAPIVCMPARPPHQSYLSSVTLEPFQHATSVGAGQSPKQPKLEHGGLLPQAMTGTANSPNPKRAGDVHVLQGASIARHPALDCPALVTSGRAGPSSARSAGEHKVSFSGDPALYCQDPVWGDAVGLSDLLRVPAGLDPDISLVPSIPHCFLGAAASGVAVVMLLQGLRPDEPPGTGPPLDPAEDAWFQEALDLALASLDCRRWQFISPAHNRGAYAPLCKAGNDFRVRLVNKQECSASLTCSEIPGTGDLICTKKDSAGPDAPVVMVVDKSTVSRALQDFCTVRAPPICVCWLPLRFFIGPIS